MSTRNTRSTRTTPDDQTPDIAQLVAQEVQAAIPNIVTQVVSNLIARRKNGEVILSIKWKDGKARKVVLSKSPHLSFDCPQSKD
ncbi:hypothetical protein OSB04_un000775 [Centaurea solstitialis]|uniref:Uncharacterized protein n=1 Tax=Centaurea solstitialis TaxID=347529 RepID=A0AA38W397_9ASTR|nr:hypothetical protein OSB04_un000775 [Centaurea solstitialis]